MSIVGLIIGTSAKWHQEALCAQVDPELFWPVAGESPRDAKRICAECPVRHPCLQTALDNNEPGGVWGGLTFHERKHLRRERPKSGLCPNGHPAPDGVFTRNCPQCRQDRYERYTERVKAGLVGGRRGPSPDMPHGAARYRLGCHCDVCREANTEHRREQRTLNRANPTLIDGGAA